MKKFYLKNYSASFYQVSIYEILIGERIFLLVKISSGENIVLSGTFFVFLFGFSLSYRVGEELYGLCIYIPSYLVPSA